MAAAFHDMASIGLRYPGMDEGSILEAMLATYVIHRDAKILYEIFGRRNATQFNFCYGVKVVTRTYLA